jgi:hypothetical protein
MMRHFDVLNRMLANTCPREVSEDGIRTFELDLHCAMAIIKAKTIEAGKGHAIRYEIVDCKFSDS